MTYFLDMIGKDDNMYIVQYKTMSILQHDIIYILNTVSVFLSTDKYKRKKPFNKREEFRTEEKQNGPQSKI